MAAKINLISMEGNSFISNGKVHLDTDLLPLRVVSKMFRDNYNGFKHVNGVSIENPSIVIPKMGIDRKTFNSLYQIFNNMYVSTSLVDVEEYSAVCDTVYFFDLEESRWRELSSSVEKVVKTIYNNQNSLKLDNLGITLVKSAVREKRLLVNSLGVNLNESSLVKTIYASIHKEFGINKTADIYQRDLSSVMKYILNLGVHAVLLKTKKVVG